MFLYNIEERMSDSISYSELREHLKEHLDRVCDDNGPLFVTRKRGEEVVILSREDYASLEETAYLLRSPANARRLAAAVKRPRKTRRTFASLEALRDEIGLK
jgi:antitoxin YefM